MVTNLKKGKEFLKYLDMFGTKPGFYYEKKPKFYTILGGILSIFTIFISIFVFIGYSIQNKKTSMPTVTSSSIPSGEYEKIKFGEEKIWIPIRIVDYNKNYINYEELIYPIISYRFSERENINDGFETKKQKFLNLKLCNETSMNNKPNFHSINVPLNKLFCIDMDDLIMGGSWNTLFIGYIKLDLYFCKNGIDYNENNSDCTTYDDIKAIIGDNNSIQLEMYYPQIQLQPSNYKQPITVSYSRHYYHISKYTNKIERIFLKKHVFSEDLGWLNTNVQNSSYWGVNLLTGDSYVTTNVRDLLNEGSTSRFYCLNIYLDSDIILYERSSKKIYVILTESMPVMFTVFIIFENIANMFKLTEQNKNMTELLFENLKKKTNAFQKNFRRFFQDNQTPVNSTIFPSEDNKIIFDFINKDKTNIVNNQYKNIKLHKKENKCDTELKKNNLKSKNNVNKFTNAENDDVSKLNINFSSKNKQSQNMAFIQNFHINDQVRYERTELFPYSYYFFAIFLKNCNTNKKNCCFSYKFTKVQAYLGQMLDISAYLLLQREFNILITEILEDKNQKLIKKNQKINVGSLGFMRYINDCIDNNDNLILKNNLK